MAVTFDGTRISGAESLTDGGNWDEWDTAKSPSVETELVYQFGTGNAAVSLKVGTSETGVEIQGLTATVDFSAPNLVVLFKVWITNFNILGTAGAAGGVLYVGSGTTTDRYNYYLLGSDIYPPTGGWQFLPVDPNETSYYDATDGTPNLNAVDYFGLSCTFSGTSKAENVVMDAIDSFASGAGLTWVSTGGSFQDFIDFDQGTIANRYGIVVEVEDNPIVRGTLTIGSATATGFSDSNKVIIFPDSWTGDGFAGIAVDLQNASTDVGLTNIQFQGKGRSNLKVYFDTEDSATTGGQVDATNDELDIVAHGFTTGNAVLYSKEGGTAAVGLTDVTQYFVEVMTVDTIALHTTLNGAKTAGTPVDLLNVTGGENHSLRRQPITTPNHIVTGTAGAYVEVGCAHLVYNDITLTSACTMTRVNFINGFQITLGDATLDTCNIEAAVLDYGEAAVVALAANDLDVIDGTRFTAGARGHGLRVSTTAGTAALASVLWTGYGGDPDPGKGWEFHTQTDVASNLITYTAHNHATGDPVYYNDNGGTDTIGLTDGALYFVRAVSADTFSLHLTKSAAVNNIRAITLSDGSGGETHTFYSANAAIVNSTGGVIAFNITGTGGNVPSIRNVGAATATVTAAVSVTITPIVVGSEVRAYRVSDGVEVDGVESAASTSQSLSLVSGQAVNIVVLSYNPPMIPVRIENKSFTADQDLDPFQQSDPNFNNPA